MEAVFEDGEMEDPDYESLSRQQKREHGNLNTRQKDAKDQTIQKIDNIIRQQFGLEINLKEREIDVIHDRISHVKAMLDRLRACVLAKYYGTSDLKGSRTTTARPDSSNFGPRKSTRNRNTSATFSQSATESVAKIKSLPSQLSNAEARTSFTREPLVNGNLVGCDSNETKPREAGTRIASGQTTCDNSPLSVKRGNLKVLSFHDDLNVTRNLKEQLLVSSSSDTLESTNKVSEPKPAENKITGNDMKSGASEQISLNPSGNPLNAESASLTCLGSRFYLKKRIIIGNTSKYISIDSREENDKSTHKWMMYVRGPPEDPHIDRFVKKVWFFLHPSYRPNDIVEVNKPPFHLTRRGWGEFPVRVQLHFIDPRNKRVDIIHELKLDRTYTGLQTLGAETVVDLELDRRTFSDKCTPFDASSTSIEESFSTNLVHVSSNAHKELVNKPVAEKSNGSFELSAQYPQGKKMRVESPKSNFVSSAVSSFASTPVSSLPPSRSTSPETITSSLGEPTDKFTDEIRESLRLAMKDHPLIHPHRNLAMYPYCASSVEQFMSWGIGKRRACEWQRAAAVKRHLSRCIPSCKLSTKDVLLWCRRYGYSPFDVVSIDGNVTFCKLCGRRLPEGSEETEVHKCEEQIFTSLTSSTGFLSEMEEKEKQLPDVPKADDENKDLEIDVVSLSPERGTGKHRESCPAMHLLSATPEQEWIRETCSDIGIQLKTVNMDGVHLYVIENVLLAAVQRFAEDILRQSWAYATEKSSSYGIRLITPSHVHKAVSSLPCCDFLTNKYLGEGYAPDAK